MLFNAMHLNGFAAVIFVALTLPIIPQKCALEIHNIIITMIFHISTCILSFQLNSSAERRIKWNRFEVDGESKPIEVETINTHSSADECIHEALKVGTKEESVG